MKDNIPMVRYVYLASLLLLQLAAGQDEALLALEAAEEATPTPPPEFTCPVKDYGAIGDGNAYDTGAIQAAIDACTKNKDGGVVTFDEDKQYLTGQIIVKDGVKLRLPKSATILAGSKRENYPKSFNDWYLILFQCQNCGAEGQGRIDMQGTLWTYGGNMERKQVTNWDDASCHMQDECRPHLVGVRDSFQVTIQGVELYDAVHWAVHILRSEAVALMGVSIWGDPLVPLSRGIVVDGSRRIYLGGTVISTADNAVTLQTTAVDKPIEFVLVDGGLFQSKSVAIQIGDQTRAHMTTLVFQNVTIQQSHRGLAIAVRDEGSVSGVQFTNISVEALFFERSWTGAAEPIHITAMPRTVGTKVGTVTDVRFTNISAVAEAGVVVAGSPGSTIEGLVLEGLQLELTRQTDIPGGFLDYRPGLRGLVDDVTTSAIFLEHANHATLSNVEIVWGKPARPEWGQTLEITPHSVHAISVQNLFVHDESAHPAGGSEEASSARGTMMEWVRKIQANLRSGNGAFLKLEANAARGVVGRRAASSASVAMLVLSAVMAVALVGFVIYDQIARRRTGAKPTFEKVANA
ncbi:probable polygalacturonase [Coccomyxa sp. Obi]|nr:probable polygalacturonase [Coccomyxa sp. Obi]